MIVQDTRIYFYGDAPVYRHVTPIFLFLTKGLGGQYAAGASIRHLKNLPERELTGARARRASVSEWTEKDGSVLVRDTREVTAWFAEPRKLIMDWTITIYSATGDSVFLNGYLHHAGFQFRADTLIKSFTYLGPLDKAGNGDPPILGQRRIPIAIITGCRKGKIFWLECFPSNRQDFFSR